MKTQHMTRSDGLQLAYRYTPPKQGPTYIWLSGFKSDMAGTKVRYLEDWAISSGSGFLCFDYSGHGLSEGLFEDGTLSHWRQDSLEVIEAISSGPLILVGSSMGGWLALLVALKLEARITGLVLIAPAPDFTDKLIWPELTDRQKSEILENGVTLKESDYDAPYPISRALIEDGRQWTLLDTAIPLSLPVHILQGMQDSDVPWPHAVKLTEKLQSEVVTLELIKDGDHRLSRDQDLIRLRHVCMQMAGRAIPV